MRVFQKSKPLSAEDIREASDVGDNEDADVKAERVRVRDLIINPQQKPPVVVVQVRQQPIGQ